MMQNETSYPVFSLAESAPSVRAAFMRKTYWHLALAVAAFIGIEIVLFTSGIAQQIALMVFSWGNIGWLGVIGGFMVIGWLSSSWAHAQSRQMQYTGLFVYVIAEALLFVPLLFMAMVVADGTTALIEQAGLITITLFLGLTAVVLTTKKDFSFLGSILKIGFFVALGCIAAGLLFGFDLGLWFSGAMVLLASGAILYTTSKILNEYSEGQHVGAALELFAAVALLFWYILRIVIAISSRD